MDRIWRKSFIFGIAVFLLLWVFGWQNNTWQTVLVRSSVGFTVFFLLHGLCLSILRLFAANQDIQPSNEIASKLEREEPSILSARLQQSEEKPGRSAFTAIDFGKGIERGDHE